MSTAHAVSHAKTMLYGTVSETFDSLQKGRNCGFVMIIAIDETWVHDFKPELKSQSEVWKEKNSARPQKLQCQASKVK